MIKKYKTEIIHKKSDTKYGLYSDKSLSSQVMISNSIEMIY